MNPHIATVSLQYEKQSFPHTTTRRSGVWAGGVGVGVGVGGVSSGSIVNLAQESGPGSGLAPGSGLGSGQGGLDIMNYDSDATEDYLAAMYGKLRVLCMLQVRLWTQHVIVITLCYSHHTLLTHLIDTPY